MATGDGVALAAQVFSQLLLHGDGDVEGHGVVDFVEFGQEAKAEAGDDGGGFAPAFVVGETFFGVEPGHPDVEARLGGIAVGIAVTQFARLRCGAIEQDDVDAVLMRCVGASFDLAEGAASHVQRSCRMEYRQAQLLHKGGVEREGARWSGLPEV